MIRTLCFVVFLMLSQLSFSIEEHPEINEEYALILSGLPVGGQLIHIPYVEVLRDYGRGVKTKIESNPEVVGDKFLKVEVKSKGRNPYDKGITSPIVGPIKSGETIVVVAWIRAYDVKSSTNGKAKIPMAIQKASEPYTNVIDGVMDIGSDWQRHIITGVAAESFAAEKAQLAFQIGGSKQKLEFGPVYVFNLGKETLKGQ